MRYIKSPFLVLILVSILIFSSCSSSDKTEAESVQNISIAPGTAIVSGQLLSFEEFDRSYTCAFKVTKVNEYGSSVPLLQKDSEIEIKLNKSILTKANFTSEDLKPGKEMKFLLKGSPKAGSDETFWQVLSIK